jgi:sulfite dehydrogenase (quinone) subunit SoeC
MHPAFSVIFLTTLIGAGQGMFLALYTGQFYAVANFLPAQKTQFYAIGSLFALILLALGLFASFFHLGRPERAWRTPTRWHASWLSREVILLPLVMGLIFLYGVTHWFGYTEPFFTLGDWLRLDPTLLIGLFGALATFGLYLCTAMIYAGVPFPEEWRSPLTVTNFTLFGLSSGFLAASAYAAYVGVDLVGVYGAWWVIFTLAALVSRMASLRRNANLKPKSTIQTAIGVRHQVVVQKSQGATGGSFNTREFFHGASQSTLDAVRMAFPVLVFVIPFVLIVLAYNTHSATLPLYAFAIQYLGLLAERWYFFAEARHPQNLYYQSVA